MRGALAEIALAGEFLTRLPLGGMRNYSPERMARAPHWFAFVGLAVGLFAASVLWGLTQVLPQVVAAGVTLALLLVVTGALHEDGFADSLDGLGGGRTPERALEIMRDSRIGTYGALGLGFAMVLQGLALALMPLGQAMGALVLAQALGRGLMTGALARDPYLRAKGTGSGLDAPLGRAGEVRLALAVGFAVLIAGLILPFGALVTACAAGLAAGAIWRAYVLRRLGGQTGDTLGALHLATVMGIYLGALAWV